MQAVANEQTPAALPQVKAAALVGISVATLWRWERAGRIEGRKVGGLRFYDVQKLKALVGAGGERGDTQQA